MLRIDDCLTLAVIQIDNAGSTWQEALIIRAPRVRFTLRQLMVTVAVSGVLFAAETMTRRYIFHRRLARFHAREWFKTIQQLMRDSGLCPSGCNPGGLSMERSALSRHFPTFVAGCCRLNRLVRALCRVGLRLCPRVTMVLVLVGCCELIWILAVPEPTAGYMVPAMVVQQTQILVNRRAAAALAAGQLFQRVLEASLVRAGAWIPKHGWVRLQHERGELFGNRAATQAPGGGDPTYQ